MATLQVATTSNSVIVTDLDAVEQLCEAHCFSGLKWRLTEDGEFSLWGYEALQIYARLDDDTIDFEGGEVTREFLWKLAEYIEDGDELDIQSAGFIKCRHPVHACRYIVRPDELLYANLGELDSLERGTAPQPP